MNQFNYNCPADRLLLHVTLDLEEAGFNVKWTFNLRSALASISDCPCPYHRTTHCDCQYLVLLVGRERENPVTLVLHGRHARSWLTITDDPTRGPEGNLKAEIVAILRNL
jgi:hypothetical protein